MKLKRKKSEAGFSLVELMVVVGIIGILASLGMPKLQVFMAKARQTEAKTKLTQFYTLNEMYYVDNGVYSATPPGYTGQDGYYVGAPTGFGSSTTTYTVTVGLMATKKLCGAISTDNWTIDNTKALSNPSGNTPPNCG